MLIASHALLLRLPYFWDEAGYYVPAARDLAAGSLIPKSTPSNAHPPLVLAWLALWWKVCGEWPLVTRIAMLLLAAFSLLGFFRLSLAVSNKTVAAYATVLTAIYPVFFAQSSLAQVDLPAGGLIFWGLEAYFRKRLVSSAAWFSLAALTKETAILAPLAVALCEITQLLAFGKAPSGSGRALRFTTETGSTVEEPATQVVSRAAWILGPPLILLTLWYGYHFARTGFVFGNPEFFRYNTQATLHPLRILLALLLRLWQGLAYMNLYMLTVACALAMRFLPIQDASGTRERIAVPVQLQFSALIIVYLVALSVVGGAVLARYMLPVVPLVILVCVSTIWRRMTAWKIVLALVGIAFVAGLFVNPPYGFAPEDNLAYRDYVQLHQKAETWLVSHYPNTHVLTAWPASGELTKPYLGYVPSPTKVVQIEDFTMEQVTAAADARSRFDVALVFSTKYETRSVLDRWQRWEEWKSRYFGYHRDLPPEAAAVVLGGRIVYKERRQGQWVAVIVLERVEEAGTWRPAL